MAGFEARDLAAAQVTVIPGEVLVLLPDAVAERVTIKKTPKYPAIAKAAKVEGIVRLVVRITEAGAVEPLRLLAGNPMLDVAAIEGLRAWRFNPSLSPTGQPIAVEVVVDVVFVDAAVHETVRQEFAGTELEEAVDRFDDGVKRQKEIVDNLTRSGRSADAASAQRAALLASLRQALEEQIEVLTELGKLKDADRASKKLTAQPTSVP